MRTYGTVVRGVRAPIVKQGDDLVNIVCNSVMALVDQQGIALHDKDVIGVTESVLGRAQGNYASVDQIAAAVRQAFPDGEAAILFPIMSRNRFSVALKGIAQGLKKAYIVLSYPSDEVGNELVDPDMLYDSGVNPYQDVLTVEKFRELFGTYLHPFTGVDYLEYYQNISDDITILLANDPAAALKYTKNCLVCDIHTRNRTKKRLKAAGAERIVGLDELLREPVNGSGYHPQYGLLGHNKSSEDSVKLFPRDAKAFCEAVQQEMQRRCGKKLEVMVYGDGAFKDPVGRIWELADPCVSPGYTDGLEGTPNEIKLKYVADNDLSNLSGEQAADAMKDYIRKKDSQLVGKHESMGTTPRQLTDLLGSLCDLTSGSGDKGTPIILIQGYFDNYADEQ